MYMNKEKKIKVTYSILETTRTKLRKVSYEMERPMSELIDYLVEDYLIGD